MRGRFHTAWGWKRTSSVVRKSPIANNLRREWSLSMRSGHLFWRQQFRECVGQFQKPKRLLQQRKTSVTVHHGVPVIASRKEEGHPARDECVRDRVAHLPIEID